MVQSSESRKFSSLLVLIYCYEKAIGLCPVVLDDEGFFKYSCAGIFYSIILCLTYIFFFFRAIINRAETIFPMETLISVVVGAVVISLQFIIIIVAWIFFAFRQKRILSIIEDFEKTGEIARKLGIKDDRWENVKTFCNRMIFVNACLGVMFIAEISLYTLFPMFEWKIWLPCNLPHIVVHNVLVLFITALEILKRRFRRLNIQLRNFPLIFQRKNTSVQENFQSRISTDLSEISYNFPNSVSLSIETFGKLHGELIDLSEIITDFFALITLMTLMTNFLQTVANSYCLCLYVSNRRNLEKTEMTMITANQMLWFIASLLEFFFIAIVSGTICDEANNTGNVLLKMWVYYRPVECRKTIKKVSLQLLQRKLSISLYGFISLDYHFIYRICGTVTTYLIIMLQLEEYRFKT